MLKDIFGEQSFSTIKLANDFNYNPFLKHHYFKLYEVIQK